MIEAIILLSLVCLVFGPALIIAVLPFPFWRPVAGWVLLLAGLVWLDERNIPFQEQGMFAGMGLGWAKFIAFTTALAVGANLVRSASYSKKAPPIWWADWQPPMAILAAVFFFHWLANRLAGETLATQAHLAAAGACLAAIVVLVVALRYPRWRWEPRPFMLGFSVILLILVVRAGSTAQEHYQLALKEADGRPFCVLTYAGHNRGFSADSRWQLSPLVSRSGGRSYVDAQVRWLYIDEDAPSRNELGWKRDGATLYRDRTVYEKGPYGGPKPFPCRPQYGGGFSR